MYVYVDGSQAFGATTGSTFEASAGYSAPSLTLAAGSTVDFVIGVRTDLSSNSTTTGLAVLITPVPEPVALGLAAAGLGLVGRVRRRTQAG